MIVVTDVYVGSFQISMMEQSSKIFAKTMAYSKNSRVIDQIRSQVWYSCNLKAILEKFML